MMPPSGKIDTRRCEIRSSPDALELGRPELVLGVGPEARPRQQHAPATAAADRRRCWTSRRRRRPPVDAAGACSASTSTDSKLPRKWHVSIRGARPCRRRRQAEHAPVGRAGHVDEACRRVGDDLGRRRGLRAAPARAHAAAAAGLDQVARLAVVAVRAAERARCRARRAGRRRRRRRRRARGRNRARRRPTRASARCRRRGAG